MNKRIHGYLSFSLVGILMVFFTITGGYLEEKGNIIWTFPFLIKTLLASLSLGIFLGSLLFTVYWLLVQRSLLKNPVDASILLSSKVLKKKYKSTTVFFFSWLLIFIAWLPCFLAFYPGLCTYDSTIQMFQFFTGEYNNHHPLFHTLLIQSFYTFGLNIFQDATIGIALYTLFQMLVLSGVFATSLCLLHSLNVKKIWLNLLLLYCCLFPFHMLLAVSITKDILFSAMFLLQVLLTYILLIKGKNSIRFTLYDMGLFLVSVFMMLFRNNGRYVVLFFLAFNLLIIIFNSKKRLLYTKIFIVFSSTLIVSTLLLSLLDSALAATPGDKREMLSLPMQQMARTYTYHQDTMSQEELAYLQELILLDGLNNYNPTLSDPVKSKFITSVMKNKLGDFIHYYFTLWMEYPGDYLNAVLTQNGGYWNLLDNTHAYIYQDSNAVGLEYVQTYTSEVTLTELGIQENSLIPGLRTWLVSLCNNNFHLNLPILRYIFIPATYLWIFLFLSATLFYQKRYEMLVPLLLITGYYLTCFLGPAVQLRYIYPVMITLPFVLALLISRPEKD